MATRKGRPLSTIPEEGDDLKTPVDPAFIEYGSEDSYTVASGNYPVVVMSESIVKLERAWSESVDPGSVLSLRYISPKPIKARLGPTIEICKK